MEKNVCHWAGLTLYLQPFAARLFLLQSTGGHLWTRNTQGQWILKSWVVKWLLVALRTICPLCNTGKRQGLEKGESAQSIMHKLQSMANPQTCYYSTWRAPLLFEACFFTRFFFFCRHSRSLPCLDMDLQFILQFQPWSFPLRLTSQPSASLHKPAPNRTPGTAWS